MAGLATGLPGPRNFAFVDMPRSSTPMERRRSCLGDRRRAAFPNPNTVGLHDYHFSELNPFTCVAACQLLSPRFTARVTARHAGFSIGATAHLSPVRISTGANLQVSPGTLGNMRPVIASSFPTLISSRLKKFAGIFPYRYNTKIRGGFLKFLKKSPRPAVAGRVIKWGVVWFSRQPEQGL